MKRKELRIALLILSGAILLILLLQRQFSKKAENAQASAFDSLSMSEKLLAHKKIKEALREAAKAPDDTSSAPMDTVLMVSDTGISISLRKRGVFTTNEYLNVHPSLLKQKLEVLERTIELDTIVPLIKYGPALDITEAIGENEITKRNIRQTFAIIPRNQLIKNPASGRYELIGKFGIKSLEGSPICAGEAFFNQPNNATGTAFLYEPGKVVTANHNLGSGETRIDKVYFVADYEVLDTGEFRTSYAPGQIFTGTNIKRETDLDLAVVTLDKPVPWFSQILINNTPLLVGESLVMIGHPLGWPKKITKEGKIIRFIHSNVVTDLDAFKNNSGSPVFRNTGEFVGIFLLGEVNEFIPGSYSDGRCFVYRPCMEAGTMDCNGEQFCDVKYFKNFLTGN